MSKDSVFMYYSGATDKTGKALVEALKITGGNTKPTSKKSVVIGWGAKTRESVKFAAGTKVLNHPDHIRSNRNKFKSLGAMKAAQCAVADFVKSEQVVASIGNNSSTINLPLVARTNFHQGGKGFWLCMTQSQVQTAIKQGAQYFQNYLDIVDEFRLHIFQGKLIYAQKKVPRKTEDMSGAFVEQYGEKVKALSEKKGQALDENTMNNVLGAMAERTQPHPDMIIRSNTRGWKFSNVKLSNVNKPLLEESIKALTAIKLDFGAVDCCTCADGSVAIIEVNSGPGLQGTPFDIYTATFAAAIKEILTPAKKTVAAKQATASEGSTRKPSAPAGSAKARLAAQAEIMTQLSNECTEAEAEALGGVWARVASKQR